MAKAQGSSSFWAELLKVGLYKRNQGRLARQLTGVAIAVIVAMGAWRLSQSILSGYVDSYWVIEVVYTATERNPEFDETIREIAAEHDPTAIFVEGRDDSGHLLLEILLPTSVFYATDEKMDENKNKLAKKIQTQLDAAEATWDVEIFVDSNPVLWITYGIPFGVFAAGAWIAYRLVNYPRYVDFLVSVEAEIDKVTWASRQQLYRYTVVVVATMFLMGVVLFVYDVFWQKFFKFIGFLQF